MNNHRIRLKHFVEVRTGKSMNTFLSEVGLSRQLWAYHGYDIRAIRPELVKKMCKVLKCTEAELMAGLGVYVTSTSPSNQPIPSDQYR